MSITSVGDKRVRMQSDQGYFDTELTELDHDHMLQRFEEHVSYEADANRTMTVFQTLSYAQHKTT